MSGIDKRTGKVRERSKKSDPGRPLSEINWTLRQSQRDPGNLEVSFTEKPEESVRLMLKAAGYAWSSFDRVWYGPATSLPAALVRDPGQDG